MSEWKEYKLEELTISKGCYGIGAPAIPYTPNKHKYLRITDINDDGTLNRDSMLSVDDKNADNYILKKNDIVFARTGNSTGRTYFYDGSDGDLVYAGFLIKFSLNEEKVNPRILKYYTHSKPYYDWVNSFDTGGTRGNINAKTYGAMPIVLPSRKVQDKIVSILKPLDDKIELNRRINENLEQQAQALFKNWFVDFEFPNAEGKPYKSAGGKLVDSELGAIPEGWKVGCLKDISNIIMGQSPKGESFNEQGNGIVFYQGRTQFGTRYPSVKLYTTEPTRYAEPFSVLLSVRAPVGDVNIATQRCCIGRGVASIQSLNGCNFFVFYIMRCTLQPLLQQYNGEGTVFGCINRKALEDIKIIIPPMNIIKNFETIIGSHENLMYKLFLEGKTLVHTRNTLLPKLMKGEIYRN